MGSEKKESMARWLRGLVLSMEFRSVIDASTDRETKPFLLLSSRRGQRISHWSVCSCSSCANLELVSSCLSVSSCSSRRVVWRALPDVKDSLIIVRRSELRVMLSGSVGWRDTAYSLCVEMSDIASGLMVESMWLRRLSSSLRSVSVSAL